MQLLIKNMVCNRCIMIVQLLADKTGIKYKNVRLGEIELYENPDTNTLQKFADSLEQSGFELLDEKKKQVIEKIKNIVIQHVHYSNNDRLLKFSELLSSEIQRDYSYLSKLFSQVEGITIEKFIINQKIEKVKELLVYNELSLSEIAFQSGYSSAAHLSNQFKKVTGLTPKNFKELKSNGRKSLDEV